jgi:hypothetical protein
MNKKVTFPERVERLQSAAESLRIVLEIIEAEATVIADAHKRLPACRAKRSGGYSPAPVRHEFWSVVE